MRLLLSGGSHRGTLGAIGAIGYFLWSESSPDGSAKSDRWSDIDEIVSVSGGSLLNAALATTPAATGDETAAQLAAIRRRLAADGLLPHRSARRLVITGAAVVVLACAAWMIVVALGLLGPEVLHDGPWPFVIGLAVVPVVIGVVRRLVTAYQRDVIDRITLGTATSIEDVRSKRRHIICASGLASGLPYYFVIGGSAPFEPSYGAALDAGFTTADAAAASMALPGLGRTRAPIEFRRELLVDGGVSGGFGEQVSTTTIRRRPQDTWRSAGDWFAIDAVRHMNSNSRLGQKLQSLSMVLLLGRWLKVSLEATYVNDLIDLGPGQYARVWSPNDVPVRPTTVYRDGTEAAAPHDVPVSDERRRLGELQDRVGEMGLFSLNSSTVDLGIVVGFVSTLEVRRGLTPDSVIAGLTWLDDRLDADGQLVALWTGSTESRSAKKDPTSSSADAR